MESQVRGDEQRTFAEDSLDTVDERLFGSGNAEVDLARVSARVGSMKCGRAVRSTQDSSFP